MAIITFKGKFLSLGNSFITYIKKIFGTGVYSSYAMDVDSNIWTTGYNAFGQLGVGDTTNRYVFTKVLIQ